MAERAQSTDADGHVEEFSVSNVKLRILLVIETCGGGSGRHLVDLAGGLLRRGHHVCLIYSPARADEWFVRAINNLEGLLVHSIDMRRNPGWRDVNSVRLIRRAIAQLGPFDIVHGHSSKAGALLRLAHGRDQSACVYTPHAFITLDPDLGFLKRRLYSFVEYLLAKVECGIICVSDEEARHALTLGVAAEKLHVVNNGLVPLAESDRRSVRNQLGLAETAICVGFVGRISHQKAVDRLVNAFADVCGSLPDLHLVIVGDGPFYDDLQALASDLGVAERIIFTGQAAGSALMAGFDIFALPSRYEAFPYVFLEAAARGLPIITMDVGGASAVVQHGVNGYMVPQDNVAELGQHIATLSSDPKLRRSMSQQSRTIADTFTDEHMVEQTIAVYQRLLDGQLPETDRSITVFR